MPKFVGDWLRDTNVTGRLRSNKVPNKLIQDLEWRYMLCAACEGRFSVFEGEVCQSIFLPIHERRQDRFRYGPSFARFAVSVAWRALVALRREGALGNLNEIPGDVEAAEVAWREFLLEQRATPAPHVVHALPMDVPTNLNPEGISPHYGRFVLRTPAIGMRCLHGAGYVIVKMARLIVFGTVAPGNERKEWRATQLHVHGGSWGVEEYHVPGWLKLVGLTWANVDLDVGTVTICQQLDREGATPVFGPTKTHCTRTLPLNGETVARLRTHRRTQAELKLKNRTSYCDFGLVFAKEHTDLQRAGLHSASQSGGRLPRPSFNGWSKRPGFSASSSTASGTPWQRCCYRPACRRTSSRNGSGTRRCR
jgi:hypothetical protein